MSGATGTGFLCEFCGQTGVRHASRVCPSEYTILKRYEAEMHELGAWIVEHYPGEIADGIRRGESTITVAHRLLERGLVRHQMVHTLVETFEAQP